MTKAELKKLYEINRKRVVIGGKKGNKYFSLAKDYKTESEAMKDFNKFKTKLKKS